MNFDERIEELRKLHEAITQIRELPGHGTREQHRNIVY